MGSADYLFRISMDATGAMASAKAFSQQLQKELGNVKIKPVNMSVVNRQFSGMTKAAGQTGAQMGTLLGQQMETSIQRFQSTAARAQMSMGDPLVNALETSMIAPSKRGIAAVNTLEKRLKSFDAQVGKMGFTAGQWEKAGPIAKRAGALQAAQRQVWGIRGMGAQMGMYGTQMMAGGAAVLGGAGMAAKEYGEFAEPLGRAARNLELNDKLTKELDASLRQLAGTASVFDPTQQAEGLYLWAAATGEVVETSSQLDSLLVKVGAVQKLASLGMVSYGTAVASVTDIQSQFQLNVSETENVVATLVKVAATSKAEVGDLAEAFKYAGTYAHQTNTTFSETAGIFQLLSAYGQRGSMAGRGMARLMEGLIAPSKQAKKALDEVFEATFGRTDVLTNAEGKFIGMANTIRTLAEATEKMTEAERAHFVATITTQNAARVLLPLLSAEVESRKLGISAIEENVKILSDQADTHTNTYVQMMKDVYGYTVSTKSATQTMEDQWSQFLDSTDGRLKKSQASIQSAIVSIGAAVMEFALPAMEKFADIMRDIADYAETHPGAVGGLLTGATVFLALGALVKVLGGGIALYADVKALTMAAAFKGSVNEFGVDVAAFVAGVNQFNLGKVGTGTGPVMTKGGVWTVTGKKVAPKAAGAAAGAGAMGGASVAGIVGMGAAIAVAAGAALELGTQLQTGRSFLDLMSSDAEALAAGLEAASKAAEIIAKAKPGEALEDVGYELDRAERDQKRWADWLRMAKALQQGVGGVPLDTETAKRYAYRLQKEVPEEYRPKYGVADLRLIGEGHAEATARVEELTRAERELWVAEGQGDIQRADSILLVNEKTRALAALAAAAAEATMPTAADLWGTRYAAFPEKPEPAIQESGALMAALLKEKGLPLFADWTVALGKMRYEKLYELAEVLGLDAEAMDEFIRSMSGVEGQMNRTFGSTIQNAITMLREYGRAIPTEGELAGQLGGGAKGTWSSLQGLQGAGWDSGQVIALYQEYLTLMGAAYEDAAEMGRWQGELYVQSKQEEFDKVVSIHLDANAEMDKQAKASIDNQASMYKKAADGLRGFVEGALKPTQVTAEDVAATEAGTYVDKWDEEARRMRAAMAGEQEWEHMIPEGVRAQGLDAAQKWGQNWINEFYAGMHPGAIRWDPLLDSIEQSLAMAAGKRNLVDLAIEKLAERGVTATSEQVLAAMGMTGILPAGFLAPGVTGALAASTPEAVIGQATALVESIKGPLNQELANIDMADGAKNLLMSIDRSLKAQGATIAWSQRVQDSVAADLKANKGQIEEAGMLIGDHLWAGMYRSFEDVNLVYIIAHKVLEIIGGGGAV